METKNLNQEDQWKVQEVGSALLELVEDEPVTKKIRFESKETEQL